MARQSFTVTFSPNTSSDVNCFAFLPNACRRSGQSMPFSRIRSGLPWCRTVIMSPSLTPTTVLLKSARRPAEVKRPDYRPR